MGSKGKGSEFERDICKALTQWLSGREKPYLFWRQPLSGGLATISEENADMSGDIRALTPESAFFTNFFSVEAKNGYPATSFWQHFTNSKGFNLKLFWKQCIGDAKNSKRHPMLIYRKKGKRAIIGIEECINTKISTFLQELPCISMRFSKNELPPIVFYDFKNFLLKITPEIFKEHILEEKL